MPKYFFHVRGPNGFERDEMGLEFDNLDEAIDDARLACAEMKIDAALEHGQVPSKVFEITDEAGHVVATVDFDD